MGNLRTLTSSTEVVTRPPIRYVCLSICLSPCPVCLFTWELLDYPSTGQMRAGNGWEFSREIKLERVTHRDNMIDMVHHIIGNVCIGMKLGSSCVRV